MSYLKKGTVITARKLNDDTIVFIKKHNGNYCCINTNTNEQIINADSFNGLKEEFAVRVCNSKARNLYNV